MARGAVGTPAEAGEAGRQHSAAGLCAGPPVRRGAAPGGDAVPGPAVRRKGRRAGPRQARRWALAWSPADCPTPAASSGPGDQTMRISHEAIYRRSTSAPGALRRDADGLPAHGRRALRVPPGRARGAEAGVCPAPEVMISERPAASRLLAGHWRGDRIRAWAVPQLARWWSARRGSRMLLHCRAWRVTAPGLRSRTGLRSPAMAPKRCATPSHAQSSACPNSSGDH